MSARRRPRPILPRVVPGLIARLHEVTDSFESVTAAARAAQRSEGAVRKWRLGKSEPAASDLRHLCETSGYSAEWLLFGTDLKGRCERENRMPAGPFRLQSK